MGSGFVGVLGLGFRKLFSRVHGWVSEWGEPQQKRGPGLF